MNTETAERIARDILASFGTDRLLDRPTSQFPGLTGDDAYAIAHRIRDLRVERGERQVGRKIGGTNPAMYHLTGATGPVWNFMYDSTSGDLPGGKGDFALGSFRQLRIEPEIALRMGAAPAPGMSEAELLGCVAALTHGFEFVFSPYSDWKVALPDATIAFGLHRGFVAGPWREIGADREMWTERLRTLGITLRGPAGIERQGTGADVYGSPILALKAMVDNIGRHAGWSPVEAGEIVTTGTVTELMPVEPGEVWTTEIIGAPLKGLSVQLR